MSVGMPDCEMHKNIAPFLTMYLRKPLLCFASDTYTWCIHFYTRGSIVEEMLLHNSRMPNHGSITVTVIVMKVPAPSIRVG
jgi:hypothetical protein